MSAALDAVSDRECVPSSACAVVWVMAELPPECAHPVVPVSNDDWLAVRSWPEGNPAAEATLMAVALVEPMAADNVVWTLLVSPSAGTGGQNVTVMVSVSVSPETRVGGLGSALSNPRVPAGGGPAALKRPSLLMVTVPVAVNVLLWVKVLVPPVCAYVARTRAMPEVVSSDARVVSPTTGLALSAVSA